MAVLPITQIPQAGLDNTAALTAAGASGDIVPITDDRCFLRVKNTSGSSVNVTIAVPGTFLGQPLADIVVAVPATTGDKLIPLPLQAVDPELGGVGVAYSATTNVTVKALRA